MFHSSAIKQWTLKRLKCWGLDSTPSTHRKQKRNYSKYKKVLTHDSFSKYIGISKSTNHNKNFNNAQDMTYPMFVSDQLARPAAGISSNRIWKLTLFTFSVCCFPYSKGKTFAQDLNFKNKFWVWVECEDGLQSRITFEGHMTQDAPMNELRVWTMTLKTPLLRLALFCKLELTLNIRLT